MASRTHDDPIRVYLKSLPWVLNVSGNDCSRINKLAIMIDCVFLWLVHQQASIDDRLLFVCVCVCVLLLGGVSTANHKAPNARKLLRIDSWPCQLRYLRHSCAVYVWIVMNVMPNHQHQCVNGHGSNML
jgi:hypothetical protein